MAELVLNGNLASWLQEFMDAFKGGTYRGFSGSLTNK